jgi:hypothetical protein
MEPFMTYATRFVASFARFSHVTRVSRVAHLVSFACLATCAIALGAGVPRAHGDTPRSLKSRDVIAEYLGRSGATDDGFRATSAMAITGEAVQILGKIVADRASQAAYALLQSKLVAWMKCRDDKGKDNPQGHFPSTCHVIGDLRLQDIAMAPAELRAALVQDGLALLDRRSAAPAPAPAPAPQGAAGPAAAVQPVFAARAEAVAAQGPLIGDVREFLRRGIERRLQGLLDRSPGRLPGHAAEIEIRDVVDNTLRAIERRGADAYCKLTDKDRVLGAAALAFASCAVENRPRECPVVHRVARVEEACQADQRLTAPQLGHAQSIAGHLLDAYTLQKDTVSADLQGRIVAAAEATFEIACMYAVPANGRDAGYQCKVDESKHGDTPLATAEKVALARELVIGVLERDGTSLVAVVIRAASRVLPDPASRSEPRALRALASIAAYAATYTSDAPPDSAHQQRTALLESLTRDMTARTNRGGDTIVSLGGALRVVGGGRIGRTVGDTRPTAVASPVSLTLGLGLDYLFDGSRRGIHVEAGVLDLGQYLAWDEGLDLATPDLAAALSPSLTIAYFWQRELPIFVGATAGYTPSYEFGTDATRPNGAFHVGATLGVYVPLFDFN